MVTPTTVEVPTTVPTTAETQGERVIEADTETSGGEEQLTVESSSAAVGSSITLTVLSLLGPLGTFGLVAPLLDYMGINLKEYFELFLDMLP